MLFIESLSDRLGLLVRKIFLAPYAFESRLTFRPWDLICQNGLAVLEFGSLKFWAFLERRRAVQFSNSKVPTASPPAEFERGHDFVRGADI